MSKGWKVVQKSGDGYVSCIAGIYGASRAYGYFTWTVRHKGFGCLTLFGTLLDTEDFIRMANSSMEWEAIPCDYVESSDFGSWCPSRYGGPHYGKHIEGTIYADKIILRKESA